MKSSLNKNQWSVILTIAAAVAIVPLLLLCFYVFPCNDDYSGAIRHSNVDVFESIYTTYLCWSGRYFAISLSALNPLAISDSPLQLYKLFAAAVTALFALTFALSPILCFRRQLPKTRCVGLGSLMLLIFFALIPSVSQAFHWFSAYTAFTIPSLLFIWLLALTASGNKVCYAVACLLAFLIPGGNEITAITMICSLAFLSIVYRRKRYYLLLAISLAAMAIVMAAPGNGVRFLTQQSSHPYLWTFAVSLGQTVSWFFLWCPVLLLATAIYIPLYGRQLSNSKFYDVDSRLYICAFLLTVVLAHVPVSFGLSSVVIDRTANSLLVFFIIGWFYGVNILLRKHPALTDKFAGLFSDKRILGPAVFCFLFIGAFSFNGAFSTAVSDIITGKAAQYARVQQERIDIVRNSPAGVDLVELPPLGVTSKSLFIKELSSDPDGTFNYAFSQIYSDNRVKVYVGNTDVRFEDNLTSLIKSGKNIRSNF